MKLQWIHEGPSARWDEGKRRIVGGAPRGVFDLRSMEGAEVLPCDWWRVERDGKTVGYGWMDSVWGDAEVLLAVDPGCRGEGIGEFILFHLEAEARKQGLNYLHNVVAEDHPDRERVTAWFEKRGFVPFEDGRLRRRVLLTRPGK